MSLTTRRFRSSATALAALTLMLTGALTAQATPTVLDDSAFTGVIDLSNPLASTGTGWTRNQTNQFTLAAGANVLVVGATPSNVNDQARIRVGTNNAASVTLRDATIDFSGDTQIPIALNAGASLNLNLEGISHLRGGSGAPAIEVIEDSGLTISGTGSVHAIAGNNAAGIGGASAAARRTSGSITVDSGTVYATSASGTGAGIGSGSAPMGNPTNATAGPITINGGRVTATASTANAAGIGGGANVPATEITITGGVVVATGHNWGAGIGGGRSADGGVITITGGDVTATGGANGPSAIGGGHEGSATVIITGGRITAHARQSTLASNVAFINQAIGAGAPSADAATSSNIFVALPADALHLTHVTQSGVPSQEAGVVTFVADDAFPGTVALTGPAGTIADTTVELSVDSAYAFLLEGLDDSAAFTLGLPDGWASNPAVIDAALLRAGGYVELIAPSLAYGVDRDSVLLRIGGRFYVKSQAAQGASVTPLHFGAAGDELLIGDWNGNGTETIGLRRGNRFFLINELRSNAPVTSFEFGLATDEVLIGDWDGNGTDTIALRRGSRFFLINELRNGAPVTTFDFGQASDEVLVGDWNGDGRDSIALRRGGRFFLINEMRANAPVSSFHFGMATDTFFVGDWDGDGRDSIGLRRERRFYLINELIDHAPVTMLYFAAPTDEFFVGDWNGDGRDSLAVRRGQQFFMINELRTHAPVTSFHFGPPDTFATIGRWGTPG